MSRKRACIFSFKYSPKEALYCVECRINLNTNIIKDDYFVCKYTFINIGFYLFLGGAKQEVTLSFISADQPKYGNDY